MSTWGPVWGTATLAATDHPSRPRIRPADAPDGFADSGQLGFRLVERQLPHRQPGQDDRQLTLDIPVQQPRQPSSAAVGEPAHRRIAQRWVAALLETAQGRRDRRQLDRLLARGVRLRLTPLATADRPHRVHSCSPRPDVIYAAATLRLDRHRVRALSAELRLDPEHSWRCTALDLL